MFFTPERIFLIFCIVGGYCFGLIQSAYFFSKIKKINLRYHGSGNYGTTNAWRVLGWQWGILTFICDVLKTLLAIYIAIKVLTLFPQLSIDEHALVLYTGLGVIIGHIFPAYLKFRGGKGVACAFATILMLKDIKVLGVAIIIFLLVFIISRYVSLASLSMVFFSALTLMVCMLMRWTYVDSKWTADCQVVFCIIFLMIMLAHRSNIAQLVFGDERKFYFSKKKRMLAAEEDYLSYDKYTAEVEAGDAAAEDTAIVAETAEEVVEEVTEEAEAAVAEEAEEEVEAAAEEVEEEVEAAAEDTEEEVEAAAEDAEEEVEAAAEEAEEEVETAAEDAEEEVEAAAEEIEEEVEAAAEEAEEEVEAAAEEVEEEVEAAAEETEEEVEAAAEETEEEVETAAEEAEEEVEAVAEETEEEVEAVAEEVEATTEAAGEKIEKTIDNFKDGATVATAAVGGFFSKMKNKIKDFDLAKKIGMTLDSDEEKVEEMEEIAEENVAETISEAAEESDFANETTSDVTEEISEIKENIQE